MMKNENKDNERPNENGRMKEIVRIKTKESERTRKGKCDEINRKETNERYGNGKILMRWTQRGRTKESILKFKNLFIELYRYANSEFSFNIICLSQCNII